MGRAPPGVFPYETRLLISQDLRFAEHFDLGTGIAMYRVTGSGFDNRVA